MKMSKLVLREPILTQRDYSLAAGLDTTTTNNLVARGILPVDEVVGGRGRGLRKFTPLNAWSGRLLSETVQHHKLPLADAAKIAEVASRLASKGRYVDHWVRALENGRSFVGAFMLVTWSNDCYDAQIINSDSAGRPDFTAPESTRFLEHPFMVLPLSALFEEVWRKCTALLGAQQSL
jgi:hypothetical protein